MLNYKLYQKNPSSHYIYIDLEIDKINEDATTIQLPSWRPGRYELGNFAKNVKRVDVYDEAGKNIPYSKISKDTWLVQTKGKSKIKITYAYFANELNAGACYADENQMYVNPVHLCMFLPNRMNEQHVLNLMLPDNFKVACSLQKTGHTLIANNFDELADSPFIASAHLKTDFYEVNGTKFYLHFNGECKPDFTKIKTHFSAFTKKQIEFWGDFPVNEYHFLFQILPNKFYHGVEHEKSTVIALGPGYDINSMKTYEDLLGVSSHELFHTWNVKKIRPKEMLPYNFTKENYARTGYVYEGFTTYFGDVMLRASGVFTDEQYFETLEERIIKHFHNYGRYNLAVADSSYDTWLDGYVPGVPYRKTSIYDEGNLVAFMLDVLILQSTQNKKSLKNVCRILYNDYGKKGTGYTETDIQLICEQVAGISLQDFFDKYIYGTEDFENMIAASLHYVGLFLKKNPSFNLFESVYGFKIIEQSGMTKVSLIAPYSPSWKSGLAIGDEIIAVNDYVVKNDLNNWLLYFKGNNIKLLVNSSGKLKQIDLNVGKTGQSYFDNYKIEFLSPKTLQTNLNFEAWLHLQ